MRGRVVADWYHCRIASTLRLNEDAQRALDQLVADTRLSANELINRLLVDTVRRNSHRTEVAGLFAEGEAEWADVLEFLRTV
jgi:hypothetical protein